MSVAGVRTEITVPIYVEADLEADDNGVLNLVVLLFPDDHEDAAENRIEFEEIIENLIEFYEEEAGFRQLYAIAHELRRMADRLHDTASRLEGSYMQYDLFDTDDEA